MPLQPEIIELPSRRVVGIKVISPMEPNLCPTAWDAFVPHMSEVEIEGDCYGVCRWDYPGLAEGHFAYLACFESSMNPPEGMEAWELPDGMYASVEIPGLDTIRPTIGQFYDEWLPSSAFEAGEGYFSELYPETFPESPKLTLLFPVKPK